MRITLRGFLAILGTLSALGLAYQTRWWTPPTLLLHIMLVASALSGAVGTIDAALQERTYKRVEKQREAIAIHMTNLANLLSKVPGLNIDEIGIAVYVTTWRPLRFWKRSLIRVRRDRRKFRPTVSGVRWAAGKGAVGICVKTAQEATVNAQELDALWASKTRSQWRRLPFATRAGLTWRDMNRLHGKYDLVHAVPLLGGKRAIGCIAIDAPIGALGVIDNDDVARYLSDAAEAIVDASGTNE